MPSTRSSTAPLASRRPRRRSRPARWRLRCRPGPPLRPRPRPRPRLPPSPSPRRRCTRGASLSSWRAPPCRGVSAAELLGGGAQQQQRQQQLVAGAVAGRFVAARAASGAAGVARLVACPSILFLLLPLRPLPCPDPQAQLGREERLQLPSSTTTAVTALALFVDEEGWFGGGGAEAEEKAEGSERRRRSPRAAVGLARALLPSLEFFSLPLLLRLRRCAPLACSPIYAGAGDGARAMEPRAVSSSSSAVAAQPTRFRAPPLAPNLLSPPPPPFPPILELLVFHPGPSDPDGLPDADGPRTAPLLLARPRTGACGRGAPRGGTAGGARRRSEEEGKRQAALQRLAVPGAAAAAPLREGGALRARDAPGPSRRRGRGSPPLALPGSSRSSALGEAAPRHSGVFVCGGGGVLGGGGGSPGWWLVSSRGALVAHPHHASGPLAAAASPRPREGSSNPRSGGRDGLHPLPQRQLLAGLHRRGRSTVAAADCRRRPRPTQQAQPHHLLLLLPFLVHICAMPRAVRLDTPWPSQRAPLRGTPAALAWHAPARLAAVGLHRPRPPRRAPRCRRRPAATPPRPTLTPPPRQPSRAASPLPGALLYLIRSAARTTCGCCRPGGGRRSWRAPLLPGERATAAASVSLRDGGPGNAAGA